MQAASKSPVYKSSKSLKQRIYEHRWFYLMFLPVVIFAATFFYAPMLGIRYSFYDYKAIKEPVFVGLKHFEKMFALPGFWSAFRNTLFISIGKLLVNTFMAVILSILLNEIISVRLKKISQTIIYLPHFLSWVATYSVFAMILAPTQQGLVNTLLINIGILEQGKEIYFLGSEDWWLPTYFITNIWKDTGWGTIIYMATLSSISPELFEAASIDGASRWQKIRYITIPSLMTTIIIVLILNLAKVMNIFESVFVMMNDAVVRQADVLQTYIYTQTFNSGALPNYGYTTAVGLIRSLVAVVLVVVSNYASKKVRGRGIV